MVIFICTRVLIPMRPAISVPSELLMESVENTGMSWLSNVSSYTKGINGLMVDLSGAHGAITASDFAFRIGNNNSPDQWATAPAPIALTVRASAGVQGSDRIEITWADGAIRNTWLQVIVKGNDALGGSDTNTNLAASDVFYFGSAPGDSGADDAGGFAVNLSDETSARNDPHSARQRAAKNNVNDFNRDGLVNAIDQQFARNFATTLATQLNFLNLGVVVLSSPEITLAAGISPTSVTPTAVYAAIGSALVNSTESSLHQTAGSTDDFDALDEVVTDVLAGAVTRAKRLG